MEEYSFKFVITLEDGSVHKKTIVCQKDKKDEVVSAFANKMTSDLLTLVTSFHLVEEWPAELADAAEYAG